MPISNTTLVRATTLLLLAGLAALLAIVGTTIWLADRTQVHFDEVLAARDFRAAAVDLRTFLQDAETGQRGFLLTREETYLEPFVNARDKVIPALEALEKLAIDNQTYAVELPTLRRDVEKKLGELDTTITLAREGDFGSALVQVETDQGKAAMDQARAILGEIVRAADERLTVAADYQRNTAGALRWVTIIGAVVIVLVVGGSALTVISYTRELVAARRLLETTNVRLEERVLERTADLANANEEVQRFAYIVTHDLRAPLVNIMGFTSELEASLEPIGRYMEQAGPGDDPVAVEARTAVTEDLPEAIGFIRSSTRKMDSLINAILKISRDGKRPVKPEEVDLGAMLAAVTASIQHQVSERDGRVEIQSGLPSIVSDRLSLEQIFGNLLDNAVKYADPTEPLRIRISGGAAPGNRFFIDVADNGRGIAAQDHARVFELFRRSGEQSKPGEGIGLAHVRTLVRNLGGDISLQSELGKGSTFRVMLSRNLRAIVGSSAA